MTEVEAEEFTIPFGKYKGIRLLRVYQLNPQYLKWLNTIVYDSPLKEALTLFLKNHQLDDSFIEKSMFTSEETKARLVSNKEDNSNRYNCGWGCTSYNPCCDACDSYLSDVKPGMDFRTEEDYKKAHKRALNGLSPWYGEDIESDEGDVGW